MVCLDLDHPDIEDFIELYQKEEYDLLIRYIELFCSVIASQ